jgi:hypothetical protein
MAQGEIACPKCHLQMQEGFLLDKGGMSAAEWIKGPPESAVRPHHPQPNIGGWLAEEKLAEVDHVVGCKLRQIYART